MPPERPLIVRVRVEVFVPGLRDDLDVRAQGAGGVFAPPRDVVTAEDDVEGGYSSFLNSFTNCA